MSNKKVQFNLTRELQIWEKPPGQSSEAAAQRVWIYPSIHLYQQWQARRVLLSHHVPQLHLGMLRSVIPPVCSALAQGFSSSWEFKPLAQRETFLGDILTSQTSTHFCEHERAAVRDSCFLRASTRQTTPDALGRKLCEPSFHTQPGNGHVIIFTVVYLHMNWLSFHVAILFYLLFFSCQSYKILKELL